MSTPDTITAISTPIGTSGIGIVRLSGPASIDIADRIFESPRNESPLDFSSHTIHYGFIVDNGRKIDEVLLTVMRAPQTYTKEDIVEINCHGGIVPLREVLELTQNQAARLAEPGEFTKRAFLNGRLSLDQAKSVQELIESSTRFSLELSMERLEGKFSDFLDQARERLIDLMAQLEVGMDFPDYESSVLDTQETITELSDLVTEINDLLDRSKDGKILQEGHKVAILGQTNVGKSTLLNKLLQEERAIVTSVPGTTRDTIEEELEINGIPFQISDTAGFRDPENVIEEKGISRTKRQSRLAKLTLFLVDANQPLQEEDHQIADQLNREQTIVLLNKTDLNTNLAVEDIYHKLGNGWMDVLEISAKTGEGLDQLEKVMTEAVWGGKIDQPEHILLLNMKEKELLKSARDQLEEAIEQLKQGTPIDLVEIDIRSARKELGKLLGEDLSEQVIDRIFSDFCVGK